MDTKNVFLIMRKEAVESLRNRWFILYTLCFSALALLVLLFSTMGGDIAGFSGFGRTAASLINLVLLFVPLIAIITGGMSISQERENGTLPYLLSHPINKNEIFVGNSDNNMVFNTSGFRPCRTWSCYKRRRGGDLRLSSNGFSFSPPGGLLFKYRVSGFRLFGEGLKSHWDLGLSLAAIYHSWGFGNYGHYSGDGFGNQAGFCSRSIKPR